MQLLLQWDSRITLLKTAQEFINKQKGPKLLAKERQSWAYLTGMTQKTQRKSRTDIPISRMDVAVEMRVQAIFVLLFLALSGCCNQSSEQQRGREIEAVTAPDSSARAFVWEPEEVGGLGATTSQIYQVWMQRLGDKKEKELMLEADKTSGFKLSWKASGLLEICYEKAQIFGFHNQFNVMTENPPGIYGVEVVLRKVDSLSACQAAAR